jgi:hypothetical protein
LLPFAALNSKLSDALRGNQARLVAELFQPDGSSKLVFEDESVVDIDRSRRTES